MNARNEPYELVRLANGSFSVRSVAEAETFHPVAGPVAEAEALYVRQLRLPERIHACRGEFVIWDVGLGAAANPVTAIRSCAGFSADLHIISFDRTTAALAFALEHTHELDYLRGFEAPLRDLISERGTDTSFQHGSLRVHWQLRRGDFPGLMQAAARELVQTGTRSLPAPDVIFYDAFSPARNAEMWTLRLLKDVYTLLDSTRPCSLATFSRSTLARASLLLAGFHVGSGQTVAGKEETTVAANTPLLLEHPLPRSWLERARKSHSAEPLRTAAYLQQPLTTESRVALEAHPQFTLG